MKEQKTDPRFLDHVSRRILSEKYKYFKRKVDQSPVFAALLSRKLHLFV